MVHARVDVDDAAELARAVLVLNAAPALYAALNAIVAAIMDGNTDAMPDLTSDAIAALRQAEGQ